MVLPGPFRLPCRQNGPRRPSCPSLTQPCEGWRCACDAISQRNPLRNASGRAALPDPLRHVQLQGAHKLVVVVVGFSQLCH